jgi:hypothetical protein
MKILPTKYSFNETELKTKQEYDFIIDLYNHLIKGMSLYKITILKELLRDKPNTEQLIQSLKDQQKDNPRILRNTLGNELAKLLKDIK